MEQLISIIPKIKTHSDTSLLSSTHIYFRVFYFSQARMHIHYQRAIEPKGSFMPHTFEVLRLKRLVSGHGSIDARVVVKN